MRFIAPTTRGGTRGHRRTSVRRALAGALLLVAGWTAEGAAQLPDTFAIVNRATATYSGAGVTSTSHAESRVVARRTPGVALSPPRDGVIFPGGRRVFAHLLENRGDGTDSFTLSASAPVGWGAALYLDLDGDGVLGPGDPAVSAPVMLPSGGSAALLLVVDAPADAAESEVEIEVAAVSGFSAEVRASVVDRLTLRRPLAALRIAKLASRADAARGDTVVYTLSWGNDGDAAATGVVVADTLPAGLRYVPGSLRVGSAAMSDAADADAGTVIRIPDGRDLVRVDAGTVDPAATGAASFRAVIRPDAAAGPLTNVAQLASAEGASVRSAPATTAVGAPLLELAKERMGPDTVDAGAEVRYRLHVANRSATFTARGVVVTDTLPAPLVFVSASLPVEQDGRVLRWRIGTLAPGAEAVLELVTRVVVEVVDEPVVNRARVTADNGDGSPSAAQPVIVRSFTGNELALEKRTAVLEASLGEAVPYVLTLRNTGGLPLRGIVVRDHLPEGTRLDVERVAGVDSVRLEGRDATFFWNGPLAVGAEHVVRYSLLLVTAPARDGLLENRASAVAEDARVRSDTVVAWVRLRGAPLASRVVLGKVWLDLDGDGRQGPDEPGVPGAEVSSADGEMSTADAQGRFSFPDVRTGTHVFRLDAASLPPGMRLAAAADGVQRIRTDGWTTPVVNFRLVPAEIAPAAAPAAADSAQTLTVAPLRTAEDRDEEAGRAFVEGPVVRIVSPEDGTVVNGNRLYVGLRGEPGAAVRLFAGERLVGETELRPDGSADFVAVELAPGPQRLRASMQSSWGRERWDSLSVHRAGAPALLEAPAAPVVLRADGRTPVTVRIRVLDEWGVPAAGLAAASAEALGARFVVPDADSAALGWQGAVSAGGWLEVPVVGGRTTGNGELRIRVGTLRLVVPLTILPTDRALIATGVAQVGVGASEASFGAMSVRGAIDERTAVTLTYDSRRRDSATEFFDRGYDLLDEGRYPTLGDGSERHAHGSATQVLSARVERGLDWVELGDVETVGFSGSERLGGYRRALTGAAARVGAGPLVGRAFGSFTDQALVQDQRRADGTSGPYRFGGAVRPGTERIAIEVRARENTARLVRREELIRSVDYQIDYRTGEVLLQRPLPSADVYGNPVFLVAVLERRSGGREVVGGARLELDVRRAAGLAPGADSLNLAVFGVHDGAGAGVEGGLGAARLGGIEAQVRRGGLAAVAEVLHSAHADSASVAGQAQVEWVLPGDALTVRGGWLRVGDGFASSLNPRLRSGLEEWMGAAEVRVWEGTRLRARHERQSFRAFEVERTTSTAGAEQTLGNVRLSAEGGLQSDRTGDGSSSAVLGRAAVELPRGAEGWVEAQRGLSHSGAAPRRPDLLGVGSAYRVLPFARVEGSQRWIRADPDSAITTASALMVRTELPLGARIWSGLERFEAGGASHAAILGWNQRLAVYGGWEFHTHLERRFGVDRLPETDRERGLPFTQPEPDRWSAAWGIEYLPPVGPRFGARHEVRGGASAGWRFDLTADAPLSRSLALVTRHDWWEDARVGLPGVVNRRDRSLLGLALRPAGAGTLNALGKVEYRHTADPLGGGALAGSAEEWRLIGAGDAIWTPRPEWTFAGRYALRRTLADDTVGGPWAMRSTAHYLGGRLERALPRGIGARLDGRVLVEGITGESRWSIAPSLTLPLGGGLEAETGYRLGRLQDPDFAAYGRHGFFALLSLRFTEDLARDVAGFWRARLAAEP